MENFNDDEQEQIEVTCNGHGCNKMELVNSWSDVKYHEWVRTDHYGMTTGRYCHECYENNYPYRKDAYFDPSYAGERMDDDY